MIVDVSEMPELSKSEPRASIGHSVQKRRHAAFLFLLRQNRDEGADFGEQPEQSFANADPIERPSEAIEARIVE